MADVDDLGRAMDQITERAEGPVAFYMRFFLHAIPEDERDREKIASFLAQFGEPLATSRDVAVRLRDGLGLTDIVRAVDANGLAIADLELRAPTLDDVFLAKTGRTLEGAAEEAEAEHQERRV